MEEITEKKVKRMSISLGRKRYYSYLDEYLLYEGLSKMYFIDMPNPDTFVVNFYDTITTFDIYMLKMFIKRFFSKARARSLLQTIERISSTEKIRHMTEEEFERDCLEFLSDRRRRGDGSDNSFKNTWTWK